MSEVRISDETGEPCIDANWQCPECEKQSTMEIDLYNLSTCLTRCDHCDAACGVIWELTLHCRVGLLKKDAETLAGPPKSETEGDE